MPTDGEQVQFPAGFVWGAATASYQIEGAVAVDGRTPSIWDTFARTPGMVLGGDTGDVADDHYHRWEDDLQIISKLGLTAYRFSISWPRVQPGGTGEFNQAGIEFYSRLINGLLDIGVMPVVTLYHWDLPQELEDAGGWTVRATAEAFEIYARRMAQEFGDRVHTWITLNEPWASAFLGYASGEHAPGHTNNESALRAVHHLNLAHGLACRAIRLELGDQARLSVALNLHVVRPANPHSASDIEATRIIEMVGNEVWLGPMVDGAYPEQLYALTQHITDWSFIRDGDLEVIRVPLSTLGINYYYSNQVRERTTASIQHHETPPTLPSPWVGADTVKFDELPGPYTAMGWNIDPGAFTELLVRMSERYPELPLMVTENGAAFADVVAGDGHIHDVERIDYLSKHLAAARAAIDAGVDLRGYFVWSLLDNFEWSYGFERRFGIIRVDYETLERIWKDSAFWYADVIRANSLPQSAVAKTNHST